MLVRDVSIYYYAQANAVSAGQVSLDFNSTFGGHIEAFHKRKSRIADAMWQFELGDDASMEIEALRAWLRPRDRNLQTLAKNRLDAPGHRDEYTCEWFQRHLLDFSRSEEDGLAIVGPAGCGKSVLSRWIIERLQRPLGKKTYDTLFFSVGKLPPLSRAPISLVAFIKSHAPSTVAPASLSDHAGGSYRDIAFFLLHFYAHLHSCGPHYELLICIY